MFCDRVDALLPDHIRIIADGNCSDMNDSQVGSVKQIQASYRGIKAYLEKTTFLTDDARDLHCQVCGVQIHPEHEPIAVCPQAACRCTSHVICLSQEFLDKTVEDQFVPTQGRCPACEQTIQWPLMMQELSFRRRGGKELHAMLKKNKKKGDEHGLENNSNSTSVKFRDANGRDGKNDDEKRAEEEVAWGLVSDVELNDDWVEEVDLESDSDTGSNRGKASYKKPIIPLPIVILDSEDDAETVV